MTSKRLLYCGGVMTCTIALWPTTMAAYLPPGSVLFTANYSTCPADAPQFLTDTCFTPTGSPTTHCRNYDPTCDVSQRIVTGMQIDSVQALSCHRYKWTWSCAFQRRSQCGVYWCDPISECVNGSVCICPHPLRGDPVLQNCVCNTGAYFDGATCVEVEQCPNLTTPTTTLTTTATTTATTTTTTTSTATTTPTAQPGSAPDCAPWSSFIVPWIIMALLFVTSLMLWYLLARARRTPRVVEYTQDVGRRAVSNASYERRISVAPQYSEVHAWESDVDIVPGVYQTPSTPEPDDRYNHLVKSDV